MSSYELESNDVNGKAGDEKNKISDTAKETFDEFCDTSSIHGVRYFGSGKKHERLYWILVFLVSMTFCSIQMWSAYVKWRDNPLIVGFDERLVPINDIPFPAITVCNPLLKIKDEAFDYYRVYFAMMENGTESVTEELLDIFEMVSEQCLRPVWSGYKKIQLTRLFENKTLDESRIEKVFKALSRRDLLTDCGGVLGDSWWKCRKGFTPILTSSGMCWTFNMLSKSELINDGVRYFYGENNRSIMNWSLDEGYMSENQVYPFRSKNIQKKIGISVENKYLRDLNHDCWYKDFNIYVHHPLDVPFETKPWNIEFALRKLTINPEIMYAVNDIQKSHTPEERRCYFETERQLKFFKRYSKTNCEVECLTNKTIDTCGCSLYWMPGYKSTPICGITDYDCYTKVRYRFTGSTDGDCNCLRLCNTITYNYDRDTLSTDYQQINKARDMITSLKDDNDQQEDDENEFNDDVDVDENDNEWFIYSPTFLWIQFAKPEFLAMRMSAQFNFTDFLSQCGGLLGLFMGVSILSIVELFYFLSVKFIASINAKKANKVAAE